MITGIVVLATIAASVHSGTEVRLDVPLAQRQVVSRLADLTTTGTVATGHTVPADWAGLNHAALPVPDAVPGIQVDGYFPDSSATNTNHGWNHDSQFVLRLPDDWNGGLVVAGSPGNRRQYANDRIIADYVLSKGYAFAATDKGNTGPDFHLDGVRPGGAVEEWNHRVTQLTIAAKTVVRQRYGRPPARTLAAGVSNGGYLVRWQLEHNPWLFDGGIDWEGALWTEEDNLFTFLPPALRAYPAYTQGDPAAHRAMLDAGFAPGSEFLWAYHHEVYWQLTQRIYRAEFDPRFTGDDAAYDYPARPREVHRAVERVALTGRITRPLVTLHGTLDSLLPITTTSDVYARMVGDAGRGHLHRYHRVEGGNHTDGLVDAFPGRLEPLGPHFRAAVDELESWLG